MKELFSRLETLKLNGFVLCDEKDALSKFEKYMAGILEWNEKVNLTSITDPKEFVLKHFLDSILIAEYPEYQQASRVIDVGTGAGFPGVPLAIISPEKEFVLMDSLRKRLNIVDELCGANEITNVSTLHGRAEEVGKNKKLRESFDLCVSRAVANLSVLSEYCLPLVRVGGYFLSYKGPEGEKEASEAQKAIKVLGGSVVECRRTELSKFGLDHRIIVIKKMSPTPSKYPRKPGTPSKEPL